LTFGADDPHAEDAASTAKLATASEARVPCMAG